VSLDAVLECRLCIAETNNSVTNSQTTVVRMIDYRWWIM